MKILFVDDNTEITKLFNNLFTRNHYECKVANSPSIALELAKSHAFDVIFLDIAMPEMSGVELFNQMKKQDLIQNAHVVILTATVLSSEEITELKNSGISEIFKKPTTLRDVINYIQNIGVVKNN